MAAMIAGLKLPTVIVQEGGYLTPYLGAIWRRFSLSCKRDRGEVETGLKTCGYLKRTAPVRSPSSVDVRIPRPLRCWQYTQDSRPGTQIK